MAFLTIQIPDNKLDYYTQLFSEYKDIFIDNFISNNEKISTEELEKMLDDRDKTPFDNCKPAHKVLSELKAKYNV